MEEEDRHRQAALRDCAREPAGHRCVIKEIWIKEIWRAPAQ
jgi:hypothetical protein